MDIGLGELGLDDPQKFIANSEHGHHRLAGGDGDRRL